MQKSERPDRSDAALGAASLIQAVRSTLLALVCAEVDDAADRAAHARVMGALILSGLVLSALAPFFLVLGAALAMVLLPLVLSAALLAGAIVLAATGRLRTTLTLLLTLLVAVAVAYGVVGRADPRSLSIALLPAVLVVAALLGPRLLQLPRLAYQAKHAKGDEIEMLAALVPGSLLRFDRRGRVLSAVGSPDGMASPLVGAASFLDQIHLLDRVAFLTAFSDLREGAGEASCVLRLSSQSGEPPERRVELRLAGRVDGPILGFLREIESEADGSRISSALAEAEEASRAKSRFLAGISHELRTPLNAIIGFTEILEQEFFGGFETPRQKEYVSLIARSSDHLLQVVNRLLDISKIEAGRYEIVPERFAILDIVEEATRMMRAEAEKKGIRLVVEGALERTEFVADRRACQQILLNLLSNAVKFTESGTVVISAKVQAERQTLTVADTGVGIAPEELAEIGQPFVQASSGLARRHEGTGLGLSLVKGLCQLHQGSLEISSRPGKGTVVAATLSTRCAEADEKEQNLKKNIVALTDVRTKNVVIPSIQPIARRRPGLRTA